MLPAGSRQPGKVDPSRSTDTVSAAAAFRREETLAHLKWGLPRQNARFLSYKLKNVRSHASAFRTLRLCHIQASGLLAARPDRASAPSSGSKLAFGPWSLGRATAATVCASRTRNQRWTRRRGPAPCRKPGETRNWPRSAPHQAAHRSRPLRPRRRPARPCRGTALAARPRNRRRDRCSGGSGG